MIINVSTLIPAISFILYIFFAAFGFMQYKKDRFYWSFQFYMLVLALWSFGSMMMHLNSSFMTPLFWNRIMLIGLLSAPFPLVKFILDIMDIHKRFIRTFCNYSHLLIILLMILNFMGRIVVDAGFDSNNNFYYTMGSGAIIAYSVSYIYLSLTMIIIFVGRKKNHVDGYGQNIYLPLIGVGIMLAGILTNLIPKFGEYPIDVFASTINALLLFYTIYKYKLINYSRIGMRILYSTVLALFASIVYFLIITVIRFFNKDFAPYDVAQLSLLIGIVTVLVMYPLKNLVTYITEKYILPRSHPYQVTIKDLSQRLTTIVDLNELGEEVVKSLSVGMKTDWVLFIVKENNDTKEHFKLIANKNCETALTIGSQIDFAFSKEVKNKLKLFQKGNTYRILYAKPDEKKYVINQSIPDADVIIPLIFREKTAGYILLGFDFKKVLITKIELEALEILAAQCSLSLKNALSFEQLRKQGHDLIMSNNKLEAIFNGISSPVCMIDIDYMIKEVNSAATLSFGKNRDEVIGKKCYRTFFKRSRPCRFCMAMDCLHTGIMQETETEIADEIFSFQFHNVKVPKNEKGVFIEIINDITKNKHMQEELIRTEKMAGIGTLAAGIAHELNNPLAGILGTGEIMLSEIDEDSKIRGYAEDIISYSKVASDVIKELAIYTRKEKKEKQSVDLVRVLEFSLRLASRGVNSKDIKIIRNYHALPTIESNESELQQLFLNLIVNAIQAMDGKGTLTLFCKEKNGFVHIVVKDTGCGIPEKSLNQIFTPFFTTKAPGKGTGLGLSNCYKIAENMSGRIRVKSEEGTGTEFTVIFPINEEGKNTISFSLVEDKSGLDDVFYIQRKVLIGEKGYIEESIHREIDEKALHILAYRGIQPVGTVSLLTSTSVWPMPIAKNFDIESVLQSRKCSEIIRLAVLPEMRNTTVSIGLIILVFLLARHKDVEEVIIDVFEDDKKTIKLYKKFGFVEVGTYYSPAAVTVLVLQNKTPMEQDDKQLRHFVRPLFKRLIPLFDFGASTQGILDEMNKIVSINE